MHMLYLVLWTLTLGFIGVLAVCYRHATYWRGTGLPCFPSLPPVGFFTPTLLRRRSLPDLLFDVYRFCPGARYVGTLDFGRPVLVVRDPAMIKEIGIKSFDYFPNHRNFVEEGFDPLMSRNVFSLKDDRWREMRTTLSPSFTANKMKYMFQLVSKCSMDFVQHLKDHQEVRKELDMKDVYTRYTNDVIATAAFGISVDSMKNPTNEFYERGRDAVNLDSPSTLIKLILAAYFPNFMRLLGFTFLPGKVNRFFRKLVYDTVKTREERGIVRSDMIHLLMQAKNDESGVAMTTEDIIAQALIFFFAGFDTSSRLMCFVSHLLARHPDVQKRLRGEVEAVLADEDGEISYETLSKMKYLDMVIQETLRLFPPMPSTDRVCGKAFTLPPSEDGGEEFTVQPDTNIMFPIFALQRDSKYFSEPDKFDPERFSDENKNDIHPYTYIPFGVGPRKCIGERFALMEAKILVIHLLLAFNIVPSPKTPNDIVFSKKSFSIVPENGFWMTLETRE